MTASPSPHPLPNASQPADPGTAQPAWSPDWYAPDYLSREAGGARPATYVPEPYDGEQPAAPVRTPSYGTVYPARRRSGGRMLLVLALLAVVAVAAVLALR